MCLKILKARWGKKYEKKVCKYCAWRIFGDSYCSCRDRRCGKDVSVLSKIAIICAMILLIINSLYDIKEGKDKVYCVIIIVIAVLAIITNIASIVMGIMGIQ